MIKSRFPWDVRPCGHQLPVYRYQSVCRLQCLVFSGAHWVRCASYDPGIVKSGLVLSVGRTLMGSSRVPRRADCGEVFQELWIGQPSRGCCAMQCLSSVSRAARTNACSRLRFSAFLAFKSSVPKNVVHSPKSAPLSNVQHQGTLGDRASLRECFGLWDC